VSRLPIMPSAALDTPYRTGSAYWMCRPHQDMVVIASECQHWAMCFNRILDVNNTEDPDADGAPPLETAVRHERPRACRCATASASVPLVIVCTAKAGRLVKVMPHVVASAFADV